MGNFAGILRGATFWVTDGTKQLLIAVPLITSRQISTVTLSRLLVSLRVDHVYAGGSIDFNALPYVKTVAAYANQGILYIVCEKEDGWGVGNNVSGAGTITVTIQFS